MREHEWLKHGGLGTFGSSKTGHMAGGSNAKNYTDYPGNLGLNCEGGLLTMGGGMGDSGFGFGLHGPKLGQARAAYGLVLMQEDIDEDFNCAWDYNYVWFDFWYRTEFIHNDWKTRKSFDVFDFHYARVHNNKSEWDGGWTASSSTTTTTYSEQDYSTDKDEEEQDCDGDAMVSCENQDAEEEDTYEAPVMFYMGVIVMGMMVFIIIGALMPNKPAVVDDPDTLVQDES
jgi:hypothetical protein